MSSYMLSQPALIIGQNFFFPPFNVQSVGEVCHKRGTHDSMFILETIKDAEHFWCITVYLNHVSFSLKGQL